MTFVTLLLRLLTLLNPSPRSSCSKSRRHVESWVSPPSCCRSDEPPAHNASAPPPKARIIQLNTLRMTPSVLTREWFTDTREERWDGRQRRSSELLTPDLLHLKCLFGGTDTHVGLCYYITQQARERRGKTPVDQSWSRFLPVIKGVSPIDIYVCSRCCWNST